jgi:site-specific DNA-cytosine methylase
MRVLSLFSGIGGFDLAAEAVGWEIVGQVEWDPFCQVVLKSHWPGVKLLSDIKNVKGDEFGSVDIIVGGPPCFGEGTLILTKSGYVPIEDVRVGDLVLTHKRRWRPVTSIMSRESKESLLLKSQGVSDTVVTSEHPYYCREMSLVWDNDKRVYSRSFASASWKKSGELDKESRVGVTFPEGTVSDDHTLSEWWMVGRYLADGWLVMRKSRATVRGKDRPKGVKFGIGKKKAVEFEEMMASFKLTKTEDRTVYKYDLSSVALFDFLLQFGRGAEEKKIPGWCLELPFEKAKALLEGYLSGDGYRDEEHWGASTVSAKLAHSLILLNLKVNGRLGSLRLNKVPAKKIIEGRVVNQRPFWKVNLPFHNRSAYVEDGFAWGRLTKSEENGSCKVFNISVEEDESYVANNAIVHNCQPASAAGKRRGTEDNRWLWPEAIRLVRSIKPRFFIYENPSGILSLQGGIPFGQVLAELEKEGYEIGTFCVPACSKNAPHRRDRLWICGRRIAGYTEHAGLDGTKNGESCDSGSHGDPGRSVEVRESSGSALSRDLPSDTYGKQALTADQRGLHSESCSEDSPSSDASDSGLQGSELTRASVEGAGASRPVTERDSDAAYAVGSGARGECRETGNEERPTSEGRGESIRQGDGEVGSSRTGSTDRDASDTDLGRIRRHECEGTEEGTTPRGSDKPTAQDTVCERGGRRVEDNGQILESRATQIENARSNWTIPWPTVASELCRVPHGVSYWVDSNGKRRKDRVARLKSLGNSVVPQVVMEIMNAIKQVEENLC